jgi:hypothetical protein
VGGAIGTAALNTVAASATASYLAAHAAGVTGEREQVLLQLESMVHGYTEAIWWGFGIVAAAAVLAFVLINSRGSQHTVTDGDGKSVSDEPVPVMAH